MLATTASRIVVNFPATHSLEFLGIILTILHLFLGGKDSRGRPDRSGEDGFTVALTLGWARGALDGDEAPTRPGFHWAVNANQSRRIDVNGPVADGTRGGNASQGRCQHGVPLLLLLLLLLLKKL